MTSIAELSNDSSFESVIEATQQLLNQMESESSNPDSMQAEIVHLLSLDQGPRGFFASFLTDPRPIADDPPESVLTALISKPKVTADFLVKNLAMSTAMVVFHTRNQDLDSAAGSQQVQRRSQDLIQRLDIDDIKHALNAMILSLLQSKESSEFSENYTAFLDRWKYDQEQRTAILDRVVSASKSRCILFE